MNEQINQGQHRLRQRSHRSKGRSMKGFARSLSIGFSGGTCSPSLLSAISTRVPRNPFLDEVRHFDSVCFCQNSSFHTVRSPFWCNIDCSSAVNFACSGKSKSKSKSQFKFRTSFSFWSPSEAQFHQTSHRLMNHDEPR